jgi:predicted transcriptional regulator
VKYRSSTEIVDSMLRSIQSGRATKTQIMYSAYLSYRQLHPYLTLLEERELIKYENGSQTFRITEKGLNFMHAYEEISQLIPRTEELKPFDESQFIARP